MKKKYIRTAIITSIPPSTDNLWCHNDSISYFDKGWHTIFNDVYDLNVKKNNGKPFNTSGDAESILLDAELNKDKDIRFFKAYIEHPTNNQKTIAFCFKSFEVVSEEPNTYYVSQYYFIKDYLYYRKLRVTEDNQVTVLSITGASSSGWIQMFKEGKA